MARGTFVAVLTGAAALGGLGYLWVRTRREAARLHARLDLATAELQRLQLAFTRFAPAAVVERIAGGGAPPTADHKDVTVLFADLVGFTQLGERLAPDVLVSMLNGYFTRMSRVITDHRGHTAKFIGDGLMALFGALEGNPWQADDAVHAALAMRAELERYNADLQAAGLPRLAFGVGIHRGIAVAGVIGSAELMEFTVIGNTVNVAARVEALTREHGVDILVTDAVRRTLDPRFRVREMPAQLVQGLSDPLVTFTVEGLAAAGEA